MSEKKPIMNANRDKALTGRWLHEFRGLVNDFGHSTDVGVAWEARQSPPTRHPLHPLHRVWWLAVGSKLKLDALGRLSMSSWSCGQLETDKWKEDRTVARQLIGGVVCTSRDRNKWNELAIKIHYAQFVPSLSTDDIQTMYLSHRSHAVSSVRRLAYVRHVSSYC